MAIDEHTVENKIGVTTQEAAELLKKIGPNDVEEKRSSVLKKFITPLYSPISLMLIAAAILSLIDGEVFNFYFILALYIVNYSIQKWQEFKADKAIDKLREKLSFDVSVYRDAQWQTINARLLVPGDRIKLGLGSIIPADGTIVSAKRLSINEAVLTGESLPKDKKEGDDIFSGSFIAVGSVEATVTATGKNTSFGKTIFSVEPSNQKSILERDILSITKFLTVVSLIAVGILTVVFLIKGANFGELITLDLSLIIAGIPIALPAVMTIILSIGAAGLTTKMVIVRRLSALQDLANVNLLLTDKTGTLTKNEIEVSDVITYAEGITADAVLTYARYTISPDALDSIDQAVLNGLKKKRINADDFVLHEFIPYEANRKRSTAYIQKGGEDLLVTFGAPQVVLPLDSSLSDEQKEKVRSDVSDAANKGFRVLAAAIKHDSQEEKEMQLVGLVLFTDPLDESSEATIAFMAKNGIAVKMVTGDNHNIAKRIAQQLGLVGTVLNQEQTKALYSSEHTTTQELEAVGTFSEILPKDKYELVRMYEKRYTVASTGDGVNDLPALKAANVSIAVSGAVSALKGAADIVLLGKGLAVIQDAILESRKIFVRLHNYSLYRISESFRLVITILILGLSYGFYPLLPLQIILLAFLNDIPIISLAVDRVKTLAKPSEIRAKQRMILGLLFGTVGILESVILFFLMYQVLHLPLSFVQTMFFLKLTVSGHMLIFVAHTKERWYRFLPSKQVIIATFATQTVATLLAFTGFLMPSPITWTAIAFVWIWSLLWMQVAEIVKYFHTKYTD